MKPRLVYRFVRIPRLVVRLDMAMAELAQMTPDQVAMREQDDHVALISPRAMCRVCRAGYASHHHRVLCRGGLDRPKAPATARKLREERAK